MKYLYFREFFLALTIYSMPIFPQSVERIEMETQRYAERLSLTREQVIRVREIIKRHVVKAEQEQSSDRGHRRDRIKAEIVRIERSETDIKKLLTPEQKKKLDAIEEERRQEMRERMKERQP
jgi:Spy/CpxP family protein refolding chaperone